MDKPATQEYGTRCLIARRLIERDPTLLELALTGGDDYELLFTVAEHRAADVAALADDTSVPLTGIGRITAGGGLLITDRDGNPVTIDKAGYRHF